MIKVCLAICKRDRVGRFQWYDRYDGSARTAEDGEFVELAAAYRPVYTIEKHHEESCCKLPDNGKTTKVFETTK